MGELKTVDLWRKLERSVALRDIYWATHYLDLLKIELSTEDSQGDEEYVIDC